MNSLMHACPDLTNTAHVDSALTRRKQLTSSTTRALLRALAVDVHEIAQPAWREAFEKFCRAEDGRLCWAFELLLAYLVLAMLRNMRSRNISGILAIIPVAIVPSHEHR